MRAVDTNILVRILIRDEPRQTAAAERFLQSGAWVSTLVFAEVVWVLARVYGRDKREVADAIEMLLQHEHLMIQDADVVTSALSQFRRKPSLGFSDCLTLEAARKHGHLPLGTFDKTLGKLNAAHKL